MRNGQGSEDGRRLLDEQDTVILDFVNRPIPDACDMLAEFGGRLQAIDRETELKVAQRVEAVDAADRNAHDLVRDLEARYLAGNRDGEAPEQTRIWEAVSLYLAQLASAYVDLVRRFQTYSHGWAEVGDRIPLVVARAIRATAMRLKWQLIRYRPVEKDIWQTLSRLWSYVEDKGLSGARVLVYDDRSTLQREFMKPLMLAVSAVDSLPPLELDLAERIIAHLADRFDLQRYPAKGCHFVFDIDHWIPPGRYTPGAVVRLGSRFFGPGKTVVELDNISSALASGDVLPTEVNLPSIAEVESAVEVLAHLGRHWWVRRPERREERRRSLSEIAVILGFDEIVARVATAGAPAAAGTTAMETWGVENESEGGYGAVLPTERGEKLRVGEIVGVKPLDSRMWAVGIVRRLAAQDDTRRYIGIQLLARGVQMVTLHDASSGERLQTALLLPSHVGDSVSQGEISLLLPAGAFSSDVSLEMEVYDNSYLLEPRMLIENGDDFEMARYRILQRAA